MKDLYTAKAVKLLLFFFVSTIFISSCTQQQSPEVEIDSSGPVNPWTSLDWNNDPENFQFVIVTDRTGGERPEVFEKGIKRVNMLQPEFVMSVGDLIDGYIEDTEELNRQWDEFDEFVRRLEMPFFYVPGNHDITNKVMEDVWKKRYGKTYYHFVYSKTLFLCLNSEEGLDAHRSSLFSEAQRNYIQTVLDENKDVRWTFLFLHKPVWLAEELTEVDGSAEVERSGWAAIEKMLTGRNHTVFAGHVHRYNHRLRNENKDYISLATTGGASNLRGPLFGEFDHVMWVSVTDEGPVLTNLMLEGIWDNDFGRDDIQEYLTLNLRRKAIIIGANLDEERSLQNQTFQIKAFNSKEVPMHVKITLEKGSLVGFDKDELEISVGPNSVESEVVSLVLLENPVMVDGNGNGDHGSNPEAAIDPVLEELYNLQARWEITYEFETYGKIVVEGSTNLF